MKAETKGHTRTEMEIIHAKPGLISLQGFFIAQQLSARCIMDNCHDITNSCTHDSLPRWWKTCRLRPCYLTLTIVFAGTLAEADIITSAPPHRGSFTWQRSIISTPSQNSSTTISTMQQVNTAAAVFFIKKCFDISPFILTQKYKDTHQSIYIKKMTFQVMISFYPH